MRKFVTEVVNIDKYPEKFAKLEQGATVVFGDLHANVVKFIYFLVREGIVDLSQKDYERIVALYQIPTSDLSPENLEEFNQIISNAKINQPTPKICLLGDELADRGENDYYILKVIEKLSLEKVDFEILLSNHSVQFLKQYAYGLDSPNITDYVDTPPLIMHKRYGLSLHNMQDLLTNGKIKIDEINAIVKNYYLPRLQLFGYEKEEEKTIQIFSHAPVSEFKLTKLALTFKIEFEKNVDGIIKLLDKLNAYFHLLMIAPLDVNDWDMLRPLLDRAGLISEGKEPEKIINEINKFFDYTFTIDEKDFFLKTMNSINQFETLVNDRYQDIQKKPLMSDFSCAVINVHGHICSADLPKNMNTKWAYINLDSMLGLCHLGTIHIKESYRIYTDNATYASTPIKANSAQKDIRVTQSGLGLFQAEDEQNTTITSSTTSMERSNVL